MLRSVVQGLSCLRLHGTGLAQSVAARESVCASGAAARALPLPILQHVRVGCRDPGQNEGRMVATLMLRNFHLHDSHFYWWRKDCFVPREVP